MRHGTRSRFIRAAGFLLIAVAAGNAMAQPRVATTHKDFYLHGSQPATPDEISYEFLRESGVCAACHGDYTESQSPYERWRYTMMSQAYRDPVFHASLQIANKDLGSGGDICLRCHAPMGWFQGRATSPDGSSLNPLDNEGVACSICHRSIDPDFKPGTSPSVDDDVLMALGIDRPPTTGQGGPLANGHLVLDNMDRRRGPFDLGEFYYHQVIESPLHESGEVCAACHDVSNPTYNKTVAPDGRVSYTPGTLDSHHPTGNKYDMYPVERLYSEWSQSAFAGGDITLTIPDGQGGLVGRFGGEGVTDYSNCQTCHMPDIAGTAAAPFLGPTLRDDVPQHNFAGANTWVLRSVNDLYSPLETRLTDPAMIDASVSRAVAMLRAASDTELKVIGDTLRVRITNEGGHKLPSGYAEGRRVWINVRFLDSGGTLLAERGAYDGATGNLSESDTKVYEQVQGLDTTASILTGVPEGESFHFFLNNVILKDNRIPPRGFTNAGFASVQAEPVGATYADGQHWDDTDFTIPAGVASAEVNVYHQTSSKPYIEFIRDNATDTINPSDFVQPPAGSTATTLGQLVHEQWVKWGRSTPTLMDSAETPARACKPDLGEQGGLLGADGLLNNNDFIVFIDLFFTQDPLADFGTQGGLPGADGEFNNNDFIVFIDSFFAACP